MFASVRHAAPHAADEPVATTDNPSPRRNAAGTIGTGNTNDSFGPIGINDHRTNKGAGRNGDNQKHSHSYTFPLDGSYYDRNEANS